MKDDEKKNPTFLNWLGITERLDLSKGRPLGAIVGVLLILILLTAIGAAFAVLISTYGQAFSDSGPSLGAGTLIIGLLGAPFLIWRTIVAQRTVDIAQENHITDLINKAVEGLGATRVEYKGFTKEDGKLAFDGDVPVQLERTEPNIEVRIGAILALGRVAERNLDVHVQVMRILTAYIRENSPNPFRIKIGSTIPNTQFQILTKEKHHERAKRYAKALEEALALIRNVPPLRADIQIAISTIGHRNKYQIEQERTVLSAAGNTSDKAGIKNLYSKAFYRPDLTGTDLRRADLTGCDFSHAIFNEALLCGSLTCKTNFRGAKLRRARLDYCTIDADLTGADLREAKAVDSNFMESTIGASTRLSGIALWKCKIGPALFWSDDANKLDLTGSYLARQSDLAQILTAAQHSAFLGIKDSNLSSCPIVDQLHGNIFGDASVVLPDHVPWPTHWPNLNLGEEYERQFLQWLANPDGYPPPKTET